MGRWTHPLQRGPAAARGAEVRERKACAPFLGHPAGVEMEAKLCVRLHSNGAVGEPRKKAKKEIGLPFGTFSL